MSNALRFIGAARVHQSHVVQACLLALVYLMLMRVSSVPQLTNGRAAMIGFLACIVVEAATGRGILGQLFLYFKLSGLLGENSGF